MHLICSQAARSLQKMTTCNVDNLILDQLLIELRVLFPSRFFLHKLDTLRALGFSETVHHRIRWLYLGISLRGLRRGSYGSHVLLFVVLLNLTLITLFLLFL